MRTDAAHKARRRERAVERAAVERTGALFGIASPGPGAGLLQRLRYRLRRPHVIVLSSADAPHYVIPEHFAELNTSVHLRQVALGSGGRATDAMEAAPMEPPPS